MNTDEVNDEAKCYGLFVIAMSLITAGAGVTAAIDGPIGLTGLAFTVAELIFLLICHKNRDKWVGNPELEK